MQDEVSRIEDGNPGFLSHLGISHDMSSRQNILDGENDGGRQQDQRLLRLAEHISNGRSDKLSDKRSDN